MILSNAERQRRWRDKRNRLARQAKKPLDLIVKQRLDGDRVDSKERRLAVQLLVKSADPEYDDVLIKWLRSYVKTM